MWRSVTAEIHLALASRTVEQDDREDHDDSLSVGGGAP